MALVGPAPGSWAYDDSRRGIRSGRPDNTFLLARLVSSPWKRDIVRHVPVADRPGRVHGVGLAIGFYEPDAIFVTRGRFEMTTRFAERRSRMSFPMEASGFTAITSVRVPEPVFT
jgi:hypothetical protein